MTERPNRTFAGCRVWMALAVLALLHDSATCTTDQKKHRGSSAVNATHVRACAVYNTDSQCNECYAGYQLTDGRCKRLTSSQKTTTGKSGLCHQKCGRVRSINDCGQYSCNTCTAATCWVLHHLRWSAAQEHKMLWCPNSLLSGKRNSAS